MKNKTTKLFIIGLASVIFSSLSVSCDHNTSTPHTGPSIEDSNIALEINGKLIHKFNHSNWQLSYNDAGKKFSVFIDDGSEYYTLTCDKMPEAEGQHLTGKLKWCQNKKTHEKEYEFEVIQIYPEGLFRLYSNDDKVNVVVKQLHE